MFEAAGTARDKPAPDFCKPALLARGSDSEPDVGWLEKVLRKASGSCTSSDNEYCNVLGRSRIYIPIGYL
jgi:hypothetical protein